MGNSDRGMANMPPSKYNGDVSKEKRRCSMTPKKGNKKGLSQKMMAVLQIYNQKSLILTKGGTYPPRAKVLRG